MSTPISLKDLPFRLTDEVGGDELVVPFYFGGGVCIVHLKRQNGNVNQAKLNRSQLAPGWTVTGVGLNYVGE